MRIPIIAFLIGLMSVPAWADFITGHDLKLLCDSNNPLEKFRCTWYERGIVEFLMLNRIICPPAVTTVYQLITNFNKYLSSNKELLHYNAVTVIITELGVSFPCTQQ